MFHYLDKFSFTLVEMLKLAPLTLNQEKRLLSIDGYQIAYSRIPKNCWGYIYEKYVGQIYEKEGYEVIYRGLNQLLLDGGIDLIAKKENKIKYIQCKLKKGRLGKSHMDKVLYQASNKLLWGSKDHSNNLEFILVVNNIDQNFTKNRSKKRRLTFTPNDQFTYTWLQYFLDHNYTQSKVTLKVREINMLDNTFPTSPSSPD